MQVARAIGEENVLQSQAAYSLVSVIKSCLSLFDADSPSVQSGLSCQCCVGGSTGSSQSCHEEGHAACKPRFATKQKQSLLVSCAVLFSHLFCPISLGTNISLCEEGALS